MPTLPDDQVAAAVAELIRARLLQAGEAHVPGLGTFRVQHTASALDEHADGTITLHPPRDEIVFEPEA